MSAIGHVVTPRRSRLCCFCLYFVYFVVCFLGQQFLADLAAVDDFDGPIARRHQLLVGDDAELW